MNVFLVTLYMALLVWGGRGEGWGGKLQTLSVTFTLRTSLQDVLGRPYMMSCKVFKCILSEYTEF